jgi:hypothetical protein
MLPERCRRYGFEIAVAIVYLAAFALLLHRHEFWRDEIQAWLIARDSADLAGLFHNLRYEGHPGLWHLLLMPLTRISRDPMLMQWFHATLAAGCAFIVLFASPLTRLEKALFPFGYFVLTLYGVVSRSYIVGFLLVLLICVFWSRRRNPVLISVFLALLANVHIVFTIVAIAFFMALVAERFLVRDGQAYVWRDGMSVAVFAAGLTVAIATAIPAADVSVGAHWDYTLSAQKADRAFRAFGAIVARRDFWGSVAGFSVFVFFVHRLRSNPPLVILLIASAAGIFLFYYLRFPGWIIQSGAVFVAVFAAIWIHRLQVPKPGPTMLVVTGLVLTMHVVQSVNFTNRQTKRPESHGQAVARYIEEKGWAADPVLGAPDSKVATVVGYLGISSAYYLNTERWGSFTLWNGKINKPSDVADALKRAPIAAGDAATLILAMPADPAQLAAHGFVRATAFDTPPSGGLEDFVIYRREAAPAN